MICNIEVIPNENKVFHDFPVGNWLINHGVPLLGLDAEGYYFAKSELYFDILKNAPIWVKVLMMFE